MGSTMYGSFVPFFGLWGVPYLTQVYGLPRVATSNVLMLTAVGFLISAPLSGWVSDRWLGLRRPPLLAATALYAATWAAIALPATPVPLGWLGPLCFGVASVSFLMAWLTTETRFRNVWAQAHPHA